MMMEAARALRGILDVRLEADWAAREIAADMMEDLGRAFEARLLRGAVAPGLVAACLVGGRVAWLCREERQSRLGLEGPGLLIGVRPADRFAIAATHGDRLDGRQAITMTVTGSKSSLAALCERFYSAIGEGRRGRCRPGLVYLTGDDVHELERADLEVARHA